MPTASEMCKLLSREDSFFLAVWWAQRFSPRGLKELID